MGIFSVIVKEVALRSNGYEVSQSEANPPACPRTNIA